MNLPYNTPARYRTALSDLFTYTTGEDRYFLCNTWLRRDLSAHNPTPMPVAWIMKAERLQEAQECAKIVRNILDGVAMEYFSDQQEAFRAIMSVVHKRVHVLRIEEAAEILDQIAIPLYFNPTIHNDIDIINVIPFTASTGFEEETVGKYSPMVPHLDIEPSRTAPMARHP